MKEQIEELRGDIEFLLSTQLPMDSEFHKEVIKNLATEILNCLPNNDWLEYPKHKPSESGRYILTLLQKDSKNKSHIAIGYWYTERNDFNFAEVIAFKPIPVEPFVKKNKYVEVLDFITSSRFIDMEAQNYNALIELKAIIENGDLK